MMLNEKKTFFSFFFSFLVLLPDKKDFLSKYGGEISNSSNKKN